MTGDIGMQPDREAEQRELAPQGRPAWVAPLSCVTETDIRATGGSWQVGSDGGGTSTRS